MSAVYTFLSWFFLLFGAASDCPDTTHVIGDIEPTPISCEIGGGAQDHSPPPFVLDTNISNGF